ncbi:MAG: glutamine synthetase beta-grasp domain-containing protein [Bacilli bacterium]
MIYTKQNVIDYVNEEDVKFIRLVFCSTKTVQKNISIMPNELEKAFEKGIAIDSSHIEGYEEYQKIVLHPDPDTISLLPWRPSQGRVIRMFCDLTTVSGEEIKTSSRRILKEALSKNEDEDIYFSTEFEFYLFKMDEEGQNTLIPYDNASYMDIAPDDRGENVRREICLSLHEMEIKTAGSHHAYGPGQNKIIVEEDKPLYAAENTITFESVVKTIAARNGLYADYSHRPKEDLSVSSHQIRIKVSKSKLHKYYENLKKHYDEIYLFLNNTSFLYDEYDESKNVILEEFSSSIVINRVSYTSDPYLAYSLILYALQDDKPSSSKKAYSLNEAKEIASESTFIKKHIPEELLKIYLK